MSRLGVQGLDQFFRRALRQSLVCPRGLRVGEVVVAAANASRRAARQIRATRISWTETASSQEGSRKERERRLWAQSGSPPSGRPVTPRGVGQVKNKDQDEGQNGESRRGVPGHGAGVPTAVTPTRSRWERTRRHPRAAARSAQELPRREVFRHAPASDNVEVGLGAGHGTHRRQEKGTTRRALRGWPASR